MIIGIDAASTDLSIALLDGAGEPIADEAWTSAQRQSAELLPRLLDLLVRSGRELSDTTAIAVGTGPGSFTGLRVAMALAKGLAIGLGRPLVGVASLGAWLAADAEARAALTRAGAHEAFLLVRDAEAPILVGEDDARSRLATVPVVAPSELAAAFGLERATGPRAAAAIARRALERLAGDPGGDDVDSLEPVYLRPPRGLDAVPSEEVRWL